MSSLSNKKIRFAETLVGGHGVSPATNKARSVISTEQNQLLGTLHGDQNKREDRKETAKRHVKLVNEPDVKRVKMCSACNRCRRRKKKCDGNGKTCSGCLKSGNQCTYNEKAKTDNNDIGSENRTRPDEAMIYKSMDTEAVMPNTLMNHIDPLTSSSAFTNPSPTGLNNRLDILATAATDAQKSQKQSSMKEAHDGKLYPSITLLLNDFEEDSYIGPTAIIRKVNSIRNAIASKVYNKLKIQSNTHPLAQSLKTPESLGTPESTVPNDQLVKSYVNYYCELISQRYYFYEDTDIHFLFPQYFECKAEVSEPGSISDKDVHYQRTVSNLVLGLGCRLFKLSKGLKSISPKVYFERAITELSLSTSTLDTIDQIRLLMLICLYLFYSYDDNSQFAIKVWGLSGMAMRKITQVGLHRFEIPTIAMARAYESRKRLFWSIYTFERILCLILGRSTSLSDTEINVPYPLNINSLNNSTNEELYKMQIRQQVLQYENDDHRIVYPAPIGETFYLIQLSKMREIEGKIGRLEANTTLPVPLDCLPKDFLLKRYADEFTSLSEELEKWKSNLPKASDFNKAMKTQVDFEYLSLSYHRARLLLNLTKLVLKEYEDQEAYDTILHDICNAGGGVCKSFLVVSKGSPFSYGMFSLHTIFLAGILLAYSIVNLEAHESTLNTLNSENRSHLWKYHNYLRHCSVILSTFSERTKKAASFRVLFDELLENGVYANSPDSHSPEAAFSKGVKSPEFALSPVLPEPVSDMNLSLDITEGKVASRDQSPKVVPLTNFKKDISVLDDLMELLNEQGFQSNANPIGEDDEFWNQIDHYNVYPR